MADKTGFVVVKRVMGKPDEVLFIGLKHQCEARIKELRKVKTAGKVRLWIRKATRNELQAELEQQLSECVDKGIITQNVADRILEKSEGWKR